MAAPFSSVEAMLAEATKLSADYDWMEAAGLYRRALEQLTASSDRSQTIQISELLAKSYFKGAFQAASREEFKERMQFAEITYDNNISVYEKAGFIARSKKSKAASQFASYWLKELPTDRMSIIQSCVSLAEEYLQSIQSQHDKDGASEARRDLLSYLAEAAYYASEWKQLREKCLRGVRLGEEALRVADNSGSKEELLETLVYSFGLQVHSRVYTRERSEVGEDERNIVKLCEKITEISNQISSPYAVCLAMRVAAVTAGVIHGDNHKALEFLEASGSAAESTHDSLLIGRTLTYESYTAFWEIFEAETVEQRAALVEKALEYASQSIMNLEISLDGTYLAFMYEYLPEIHMALSKFVEVDAEKKLAELRTAVEIARKGVKYHDFNFMDDVNHALSKSLYFLAIMSPDPNEREQLLQEALPLREAAAKLIDQLAPYSWNRGVMYNYLALLKAAQAGLRSDSDIKVSMLRCALDDMDVCLGLCSKWTTSLGEKYVLATYLEWDGDIQAQLHQLTGQRDTAEKAIGAYRNAVDYYSSSKHEGSTPAVNWKTARVYVRLGSHKEASLAFKKASEGYRSEAHQVPATAPLFEDLASYMEAWADIEEARLRHEEEDYSAAAEHYSKASILLQSTKAWSHLSLQYSACAFLEKGEASSQQDRQDAAVEAFSTAAKGFQEAKAQLEARKGGDTLPDALRDLADWVSITEGRSEYCKARVELEEAELSDKKGERRESARKYHSASEMFKSLAVKAGDNEARRELETLELFCGAWAKMKEAEAGASSDLYRDAVETFTKATGTARGRFRLLALANASLCSALEAGVRFRSTQDTGLYGEIKKQLQSAESHYQEGGFESSARWTQATQRLFDALTYLTDGEVEREPKRKAELYHLAEKHLELAAKLYGEAGFESKREEIFKQLEKVRNEKSVLLTPMDALTENPAITGASVAPVSLVRDHASGVERFESASVVGNLSIPERQVRIGNEIAVELEIANVGKTAATLIKLENLVPEGFELNRERVSHRIENGHINMKGKRLEYLKTDEVKVALKATLKGIHQLKPRILFVDEQGTYKSYEFEPAELTVTELGISGWIKGSGK